MSSGVGRRYGSNPTLLWLWCRPGATALIQPLAWEPPYAVGMALNKQTNKQTNKQMEEGREIEVKYTKFLTMNIVRLQSY